MKASNSNGVMLSWLFLFMSGGAEIIRIFIDHLREALDVIPGAAGKTELEVSANRRPERLIPMPPPRKTG
jgi:hypothetical protein